MSKLSKTRFNEYLECPKSFWLRHNRPAAVAWPAPSAMARTRMRDGQGVEAVSHKFIAHHFGSDGIETQVTFETPTLLARADFIRRASSGAIDIIEVKASTKVKDASGPNHIVDAAFQVLTAKRSGVEIAKVYVVHLDSEYSFDGVLDVTALFMAVDVTEQVEAALVELELEIDAAVAFLADPAFDEVGCECRFSGVNKRCDAFAFLNPDIPEDSAHHLPRIRAAKLRECEGAFSLSIIDPEGLSPPQRLVYRACMEGTIMNKPAITTFLDSIKFPIHFYDYETTGPAIPCADGYRSYQALPVQFSLHRLSADGGLEHFEWLADGHGQQLALIEALGACVLEEGSAVAWHKSFENGCNQRLAALHPAMEQFLQSLCARTIDLEEPFKKDYVDWAFRGSTSIKKVLPVLCPHLTYPKDAVHDGTGAVEAWNEMVETTDPTKKLQLRDELFAYCKLDSLAMVEIYRRLRSLVCGTAPNEAPN